VDSGSGRLLALPGNLSSHDGAVFANRQAAVNRANKILDEHMYATAVISDLESGEEERITHPHQGEYLREKYRYLHWQNLGWLKRMFKKQPTFRYFKTEHLTEEETKV
tara:strand:- start:10 stop:333 length:324 start_codon:yes stop_codon:yes gene_type:complete